MNLDIKNRVAIVTGGAQGLGEASPASGLRRLQTHRC